MSKFNRILKERLIFIMKTLLLFACPAVAPPLASDQSIGLWPLLNQISRRPFIKSHARGGATAVVISILLSWVTSNGQDNNIILQKSDSSIIRLSEMMNHLQLLKERDTTYKNLDTVPFYYIAKGTSYVRPKPLPIDTIAPLWTLISLTGEKINLNDLKGQIVLLDFFYSGCHPCVKALPFLQALHQNYRDKGLTVIGIDPHDQLNDEIVQFLAKKGVTYKILLDLDKEALKKYRVFGYPTIFLIDRKGKIIYAPYINDYKELEEMIKKNL